MAGRAGRLFHGVVVIGAALGANGCGGDVLMLRETEDGGVSDSGPDVSAPDVSSPDAPQQPDAMDVIVPGDTQDAVDGGCGAPGADGATGWQPANDISECAHPEQYLCVPSGCYCNPNAPMTAGDCAEARTFNCMEMGGVPRFACICTLSTPEQCDRPQQFWCSDNRCVCDPGAPLSVCECAINGATFWCASYDPPTSCQCTFTITR